MINFINIQLDDFETGWFGVSIGIKSSEIDLLIEALTKLKKNNDYHFHIRSKYEGQGGIGDIEFYTDDEGTSDNSDIDSSVPIEPNR